MNNYFYRKDNRSEEAFRKDLKSGDKYNVIFSKHLKYIFSNADLNNIGILDFKIGIEKKKNSIVSENMIDSGDVALAVRYKDKQKKCSIFEINASPYILSNNTVNKNCYIKGRLKVDSLEKILRLGRILVCIRSLKENVMEYCIPSPSFLDRIPYLFSEIDIRKDSYKKCYEIIYNDMKPWFNIDFNMDKKLINEYCSNIVEFQKKFRNQDVLKKHLFEEV